MHRCCITHLVTVGGVTVVVPGGSQVVTVIAVALGVLAVGGSLAVVAVVGWRMVRHWRCVMVSVAGLGGDQVPLRVGGGG